MKTMGINFWEAQREARLRSKRLFICFLITTTLCIFVPYFLIHSIIVYIKLLISTSSGFPEIMPVLKVICEGVFFWRFGYFFIIAPFILVPVVWGAYKHYIRLQRGGSGVAQMLNGSLVRIGTVDCYEKRLLNIVAEMSIASGVPMPKVYILTNEPGINALIAGLSSHDAVICVTRGATELLTRDELQGVIGHEFSHLLNGDMVFHTIMLIMMHGFFMCADLRRTLDIASGSTGYFITDFFLNIIQLIGMIILLPFWLWLYGLFFGNIGKIVKGAFSRQREYLADAAAVQFTRYPTGLCDTLKKIGGLSHCQRIRTCHGAEMNHIFFSETRMYPFSFLVAAHPSVENRIFRLDPNFDGNIPKINREFLRREIACVREDIRQEAYDGLAERIKGPIQGGCNIPRNERLDKFSPKLKIDFNDLLTAAICLEKIPNDLQNMIKEPSGSVAIVYALLLEKDDKDILTAQLDLLKNRYDSKQYQRIIRAQENLASTDFFHIPLVELAVFSLQSISKLEYDRFLTNCYNLILIDCDMSIYEYATISLIKKRLDRHFGLEKLSIIRQTFLRQYAGDCALILSVMGWAGAKNRNEAEKAFIIGTKDINPVAKQELLFQELNPLDPDKLNDAVRTMNYLPPHEKELLFNGCLAAVGGAQKINAREWDILQSFARMLECPIPLLPE